VLCEVMVGAPNFVESLLRRVVKNGLPCRSRASPPAAPHRPPAPDGIGIVPHPYLSAEALAKEDAALPRSTPPSGPAPASASFLASVLRKPTHQQRRGREAHRAPFLAGSEFSLSLCRRAVTASTRNFSTSDRYSEKTCQACFYELGMEAVWKIKVENFPAFILVDDKGNDFFQQISQCPVH
jgi:hypothetical protein